MRWFNLNKNFKKHYTYKIVGTIYQSNLRIKELDYLHQAFFSSTQPNSVIPSQPDIQQLVFDDSSLIGEKEYSLTVKSMTDSSYFLKCNLDEYTINKNSINANILDIDIMVLLGPVLILNLAINSIFCLHASAFIMNDKIFVLMADSGTGKSTIARFIDKQANCQRIADDILPLKYKNNKLTILPSFPQLKLTQDQQYAGESLELETVFLFAEKSEELTNYQSINTFASIKKLIKHSVATKLFAKNELKNHLLFCHKTCALVKSYHVKYQHSDSSLQQLLSQLHEIS